MAIQFPASCFLFFWYMANVIITMSNYVAWVRFQDDLFDVSLRNTYVAFVAIGMTMYAGPSSYCFVRSIMLEREGLQNERDKEQRDYLLTLAVMFVYFSSDLPLFVVQYIIVFNYGYFSIIQSLSFLLTVISFVLGSYLVWTNYMWSAAKYLQTHTYVRKLAIRRRGTALGYEPTPSITTTVQTTTQLPMSFSPLAMKSVSGEYRTAQRPPLNLFANLPQPRFSSGGELV